ncbi:LacI family DNA-binding transcriptional regulator [Planococcus sp. CAU13]|uniref:LacI family DNA-binding transcriptional regulator n=1 Tax=Planococcus sp. CAU13 TaxID=1541197 RepID=UPI00052FE4B2|nr:LacI family DNA-binding transcriptional regulator [Planococcus sp. CAU13]
MVSSVDVAKLAGVSQATVSRVLNNPEKVNPATVEKVEAAIQKLNYRPNAAARSLVSNQKSGVIAVLCGPLTEPENARFSNTAIQTMQDKGYAAEIYIQDSDVPEKAFEMAVRSQAEGMLIGPVLIVDSAMALLEKSSVPYMMCGIEDTASGNSVAMDNHEAGKLAAEAICSLGHRNVGWVGGNGQAQHFQERYGGFMEYMKDHDMDIIGATGQIDDYDAVFSAMMARKNRPTAIAAATDELGACAIDFLLAYGYSIPDDITVIGIGNYKQSSMNYLQLTSVGLPDDADLYREAVERLIVAISGGLTKNIGHISISPVLHQRKTSGKNT